MKKIILLAAIIVGNIAAATAQDFKPALEKAFLAFDTTMNPEAKTQASNKLGLIAKKWNDQWLTHYYTAYSRANLSYMIEGEAQKDAYVDEAERELAETVALLGKETDETYVLAAMVANARMAVKPQARWQKYGKIFEENLEKAKDMNADNPRIYYLQGTSKYFTPKMFGGGAKAAKPYFDKAMELYAKEGEKDLTNEPAWGKRATMYFLSEIEKDKE